MRRFTLVSRFAVAGLLAFCILPGVVWAESASEECDARCIVARRVAAELSTQDQADALAAMAWPDTPGDPLVAAAARKQLVGFGERAFRALLKSVRRAGPVFSADIAEAIIEASMNVTAGMPADYLPSLEEMLWHGSADAKRLAIPVLAYHKFLPALPASVDAMHLHPELTLLVCEELGVYRDKRGRFALESVLHSGSARERDAAAGSLARIGGLGLDMLRSATLADDPETRNAALQAYLPVSGTADLTALYEYLGRRSEDDPELLERVRKRAAMLEQLLERQMDLDSASDLTERP